jgi:hypothetical protein
MRVQYCSKNGWGWLCIGSFPLALANGKQRPIPEEIFQTLLNNDKQGNLYQVLAANIIKLMQTRFNREKYTFGVIKSLEHLQNLKLAASPVQA